MERVEASMTGQDYVTMNVVNDGKAFRLCSKCDEKPWVDFEQSYGMYRLVFLNDASHSGWRVTIERWS